MNIITVAGRITEPDLRYTNGGKAVCKFGLVTDRKKGEEKVSSWHNIVSWDKMAENLASTLAKGDRVIVCGYLEQSKFTDKEGNEKTSWSLVALEAGKSLRWDA